MPDANRIDMMRLSKHFIRLDMTFEYMDEPNVIRALTLCKKKGIKFEIMQASFYLGGRNLIAAQTRGSRGGRSISTSPFAGFAIDPSRYFKLPPNRVVELGE